MPNHGDRVPGGLEIAGGALRIVLGFEASTGRLRARSVYFSFACKSAMFSVSGSIALKADAVSLGVILGRCSLHLVGLQGLLCVRRWPRTSRLSVHGLLSDA